MITRIVMATILLGCGAMSAGAQDVPQQVAPAPPEIGIVALGPINVGRVVRDAPYTADAITEMTQVLADGNRIEQRTSATVARDSQGRTRREQQGIALGAFVAKNEQPIVTITDPDSGVHITLNYDLKVAFRAKPFKDPVVAYKAEERAGPLLGMSVQTEPMAGTVSGAARAGAIASLMIAPPKYAESAVEQALETRVLEGVKVEGTRRTTTIPADAIGNVQPLEIVFEQWYSPELQVIVMTRRVDPRFGETTYRLTNIQQTEPSPDLFKIPADFRIDDMRPGAMMPVRPDGF
jgi:hypothetical protein